MRIIERYILASIAVTFFITIATFCLLYVLIDSASNLDEILNHGVPAGTLIQYYLSYLPVIMVQTSSIACLIATLFTFSHLNNQNEVIALRASGLNFWQVTKPAIGFACIVSALTFGMNERLIPDAEAMAKRIKSENMSHKEQKDSRKKDVIKNLTFYGLKNRLYYIDAFDPNAFEMEGITIVGYDNEQNIKEKIVALSGKWTGIAWKFFKCHVTSFSPSFGIPTKVTVYEEKLVDIKETPEDFLKQRLNVLSMNIAQLNDYIKRFANSGARRAINNLKVDLHQKIAFPFGNVVIILVGLPIILMVKGRKAQTFTSLGVAVAIGFLYWTCNAVGLAFGKGELLPPVLAAWLAPLIFAGVGGYLIRERF